MNKLQLIIPKRYVDNRGFFEETYTRKKFIDIGIDIDFVQDNHSISYQIGTLRGLHYQAPPCAQAKLVRCGNGAIFDVVVDIRKGSPDYGNWKGYQLTAQNGHQLYIPIGFAHGFVSLEANSEIVYKCSNYYNHETEESILWNDPEIDVKWPLDTIPIMSEKDISAPLFREINSPFIYKDNS